VLPCYPLLIVLASRAATFTGRARVVVVAAIAATVASSAGSWGHELGYFNEAAGNGEAWLSDSNIDWGQDLGALAAALPADAPPIYLAYFGGGSARYLHIRHETILARGPTPDADADPTSDGSVAGAPCAADRQWIAVSTFRRQGLGELDRKRFTWLADRTPMFTAGTTIRVYDVTRDADAHRRIAAMFDRASPTARCELARAAALDVHAVTPP
jgi:hypothetical protein